MLEMHKYKLYIQMPLLYKFPFLFKLLPIHWSFMVSFRGFTLIEVLVSLLLFAIILLGFDVMEVHSFREARAAYFLSTATYQLSAFSERLKVLAVNQGLDQAVEVWNKQNKELLPQGYGEVHGQYPNYTLTIYWGKKQNECKKLKIGQEGCLSLRVSL